MLAFLHLLFVKDISFLATVRASDNILDAVEFAAKASIHLNLWWRAGTGVECKNDGFKVARPGYATQATSLIIYGFNLQTSRCILTGHHR